MAPRHVTDGNASTSSGDFGAILPELLGDSRRQAVPSIRGTVYQAWCSIDAWLRLNGADQLIYLEGAEDFDIVTTTESIAVQVKHNDAPISLGNAKAHEALENFWTLSDREPDRQVHLDYLTTSSIANERDGGFGGVSGIEAWRVACTSVEMAEKVARYLASRLRDGSPLQRFLVGANPVEMQERLFRRFRWRTDQPGIQAAQRSVDERIAALLYSLRKGVSLTSRVRIQLESRFWKVICKTNSRDRRLTFGDLLQQVEIATTAYLPIPVDRLPDLLGDSRPGLGLLKLLLQKVPQPPEPLIPRVELVRRLEESVNQRRLMLLTGTVFKGKTTVAQLVARTICPNAWWVNLTERRPDQVDNIFLALSVEIESGNCPALVIIDDIDIGLGAHRVYGDSLALVFHRAKASGRAVVLTAQGGSGDAALFSDFGEIDVVEVPELTQDEVIDICVQQGCPQANAHFWGTAAHLLSRGHPKLVQVRIAELANRRWPSPTAADFVAASPAADTVRQMACQFLSESTSPEAVEFLYAASESSVLLHRTVAIHLAESLGGIRNPGDVLDGFAGTWLERIERNWFRATPLLQGAAGEAWTPERRARGHVQLYDSILHKKTLDPTEAAALLFHAYLGKEPRRIAHAALTLQLIADKQMKDVVQRSLLWLAYVALEPGQRIVEEAPASTALRSLQFQVAMKLDADTLPQVWDRWSEETETLEHPMAKQAMQFMLWSSACIAESQKIGLRQRLTAIEGLARAELTGEIAEVSSAAVQSFFEANAPRLGMPVSGTQTQLMLVMCTRVVVDASSLRELIEWLDGQETDEIRLAFETILDWPFVQTMGAFVQRAWTFRHEEVSDWASWLELLNFIESYAQRRSSPRLGREAAKAKSTILTEYLERAGDALEVLAAAEATFGKSPVLDEQRANVLFHVEDDAQVLAIWAELVGNPSGKSALDPFAYRRAAISATRLERWGTAENIFREAIASISPEEFVYTKFGLMVDCVLAISLGGAQRLAAELLAEAVLSLPAAAAVDGDERWEAVQRAASEVCRRIENFMWRPTDAGPKFQPGYASSPALKMPACEPGQSIRTAMLRAQVGELCACLGVALHLFEEDKFASLRVSQYPFVRWTASQALLAQSFALGIDKGFIESILFFDATMATITRLGRGASVLAPDRGAESDRPEAPERWFGLLVAGVCCAGADIDGHLAKWALACKSEPMACRGVANLIRQLQDGAATQPRKLLDVLRDARSTPGVRCGAAAKALLQPLSPRVALNLQGLLTSALVSDASYAFQHVCNYHLARRFSNVWRGFADNPFSLMTPRTTVPKLHEVIDSIERGNGTLRTILTAASAALGEPLGEFLNRVW